MRRDPSFAAIARKLNITAPAEIDRLYPQLRPARVTVTTARGAFTRQADEALGSRIVPLDDAGLKTKFLDLVAPVLGARARQGAGRAAVDGRGHRRRGAADRVDGEVGGERRTIGGTPARGAPHSCVTMSNSPPG